MKIKNKAYINYKFFNSLFLGISVGSIFTIYSPLQPSIYSLGGIFLALFMLFVAKLYTKIMNYNYFYKISLSVEIVALFLILYFLVFSYSYASAIIVYIGYQVTFIFGSYLLRAETILLKKPKILTFVDVAKQKAYLIGMLISYLFYQFMDYFFDINDAKIQVYNLHFLLLLVEIVTIYFLHKAFKHKQKLVI